MRLRRTLILASASPRRAALLRSLGLDGFLVAPTNVDETLPPDFDPAHAAETLARLKSEAADPHLSGASVTLTADSVVISRGRSLGKPHDLGEARAMLRELCGSTHTVMTGFALARAAAGGGVERRVECVTTQVTLATATEAEIAYYLKHSPPLDRAGGYGVQDWIGAAKATRLEGSYTNVVGLPTAEVFAALRDWDLIDPAASA